MPSKEWYAFACDSFNACSASNSANSPFYVIPPDTTPPTLSNPQPTGISPSAAKLIVSSSENANCRFSTTSGFNFDSATQFSSTGSTSHSHTLTALPDGTHTYYFNCKDIVGNLGNQVSVTFTTFGGACADGGTEEYISTKTTNLCNGCQTYYRIYGCGGSKTAFEANNLCGAGWSLCSPYQLEDQPKPVASYWTALGAADCSARPETDYWCCVGCSCSSAPPYSHISSGLYTGIPYALRFSPLTNIAYIQPSQNCNGRYYRSYVEPVNPNLLSGAVCCETEIRSPAGCGCSSGNNDD